MIQFENDFIFIATPFYFNLFQYLQKKIEENTKYSGSASPTLKECNFFFVSHVPAENLNP